MDKDQSDKMMNSTQILKPEIEASHLELITMDEKKYDRPETSQHILSWSKNHSKINIKESLVFENQISNDQKEDKNKWILDPGEWIARKWATVEVLWSNFLSSIVKSFR